MSNHPQDTAPEVQAPPDSPMSATDYAAVRDARSRDLDQRRQLLQMSQNLVASHIDWKVLQYGDTSVWKAEGIDLPAHRKEIAETYRFFMRVLLGGDQA